MWSGGAASINVGQSTLQALFALRTSRGFARTAVNAELPKLQGSIAKGDRIVVMCGSGARATIGASLLRAAGYRDVAVYLGSMQAWNAARRPLAAK